MFSKGKAYGIILKDAFKLFLENDPLKLGGATAFFTMFALPPILIILVQTLSVFIDPQTIRHELFISLSDLFGKEAVRQVISVIRAVRKLNDSWVATIFGFIVLLFVATTVFRVIRSSVNQIWKVPKPQEKKVITGLWSRLVSLAVILFTGLLFSLGILIETIQVLIGNFFSKLFPSASGFVNQTIGFIISLFIIAVWFTIIFRYLNDKHPAWKTAWAGGLFTSILFSIGKIILHVLLTFNNIATIYGASASIVLLLLFVFYSAMILYFGAAFTKVYGSILRPMKNIRPRVIPGNPTNN